MKKLLGGVGTVVVVGAIIAFKFFGPSAEVTLKNATGSGWDDARSELRNQISQVMEQEYEVFDLSASDKNKIADCIVDKSIAFLNETDCSYLYNSATTTEAEHLANQETCMAKVKFEENQEGFTMECLKQNMPDSWKIMKSIFVGIYEEAFTQDGVPGPKAKQIGECIAQKLVGILDGRKYKLINDKSIKAEDLLFPIDKYVPDFEKDEEISAVVAECAPADAAKGASK